MEGNVDNQKIAIAHIKEVSGKYTVLLEYAAVAELRQKCAQDNLAREETSKMPKFGKSLQQNLATVIHAVHL